MAKLAGTWDLKETEGFDEYMKALNVGMVMRKMGNTLKPTQQIEVDGDKYQIKTISTFKTTEVNFKLGEEFEESTADGRKVKTTCSLEGDKLIQDQKGDFDSVLTRYNTDDDTMVMELQTGDVKAKRTYQRRK